MGTHLWAIGLFLAASTAANTGAHAQGAAPMARSEPAISTALASYNALPMGMRPLRLADQGEYESAATLPGWLVDVPFTRQEAAAVVSLQSAYRLDPVISSPGSSTVYKGRKPRLMEYVAGAAVAVKANDDANVRAGLADGTISPTGGSGTFTVVTPARAYSQDGLYQRLLGQLGGCRGALTSALQKMVQTHAGERFTINLDLLVSANPALDLVPDPACRRGY